MIRDVANKHDETKQGTMAYVESDLRLYTTFQRDKQNFDDYLSLFKANVETVNAHGGKAGFHPQLHSDTMGKLLEASGIDDSRMLDADNRTTYYKKA